MNKGEPDFSPQEVLHKVRLLVGDPQLQIEVDRSWNATGEFRDQQVLRERLDVPLLVDAGLGLPSHACQVMEWGFDGVLLNTAVALAQDPVAMAGAFANAV